MYEMRRETARFCWATAVGLERRRRAILRSTLQHYDLMSEVTLCKRHGENDMDKFVIDILSNVVYLMLVAEFIFMNS